jgi:hypothetical protein
MYFFLRKKVIKFHVILFHQPFFHSITNGQNSQGLEIKYKKKDFHKNFWSAIAIGK